MDERDDADRREADETARRPEPNRGTDRTPGATPADRPTDASAETETATKTETDATPGPGVDPAGGEDTNPASDDGDANMTDKQRLGPLEPGQPTLENALFVALGVLGTIALFASVL